MSEGLERPVSKENHEEVFNTIATKIIENLDGRDWHLEGLRVGYTFMSSKEKEESRLVVDGNLIPLDQADASPEREVTEEEWGAVSRFWIELYDLNQIPLHPDFVDQLYNDAKEAFHKSSQQVLTAIVSAVIWKISGKSSYVVESKCCSSGKRYRNFWGIIICRGRC